jgi:hypothetical protein
VKAFTVRILGKHPDDTRWRWWATDVVARSPLAAQEQGETHFESYLIDRIVVVALKRKRKAVAA